jgi:hypothetical protein
MRCKTSGDERGRVSASAGSGPRRCKAEAARVEKARRRAKASLAIARAKLLMRSYRSLFFCTISALTKDQPVSTVKILSCENQSRMREVVRATFGLRSRSPRRLSRRQERNRDKRAERAKSCQVCRFPSRSRSDRDLSS